jgi:hypothetical protein
MERNDMVLEVLALYDRIDELETEKELTGFVTEAMSHPEQEPAIITDEEKALIMFGKHELFEKCFSGYRAVHAKRHDDGHIYYTKFDAYLEECLYENKIPGYMTKNMVMSICEAPVREMYKQKCAEARDRLLKEEAGKDKEEDE